MTKLMRELLSEAVEPKFLIISHSNEATYDMAEGILKAFGWKDLGPVSNYVTEKMYDDANGGVDIVPNYRMLDDMGVWGKIKPSKQEVMNKLVDSAWLGEV